MAGQNAVSSLKKVNDSISEADHLINAMNSKKELDNMQANMTPIMA